MNGIDVESFKLFLILYADDMLIFANNAAELQTSLDLMYEYCNRWKLIVKIKLKLLFSERVEEFQMILIFYMTVNE